jgi:hypothetical protein
MCDWRTDMCLSLINYIKLVTDRQTDMKKKMRRGVLSKNIWEGASERATK